MPPITKPFALILNYTGNVYHWGCYGTSAEIYQTLSERGYQLSWVDVRTVHALTPRATTFAEFASATFVESFLSANQFLRHALSEADVVVVNGEGTLHRANPAPLNLLFLMYLASAVFAKPVHLINHSFYPNGGDPPEAANDALYQEVACKLKRVVPRETASRAELSRLGIETVQGFDCLPRLIARHGVRPASTPDGPLVISGGVSLPYERIGQITQGIASHVGSGRPACYLAGAKSAPAPEDPILFNLMRQRIPQLQWLEATSIEQWLETIASASCLVSGRFHHTIVAATLETPAVVFPSNTPKVHAICAMFGLHEPIAYEDAQLSEKIETQIAQALAGKAPLCSLQTLKSLLALAENNFLDL